jgi:two-component system, cell cycle sensor histidine kinase and response regulator CckA
LPTILLVEDEEPVLEVVRSLLVMNRYMVIEASEVQQAIEICKEYPHKIDLMITDVIMPEMSGVQLAGRVVRFRPDIRVIYMSGYRRDALAQQGLRNDMIFLQKPFQMEELILKVREALESKTLSM